MQEADSYRNMFRFVRLRASHRDPLNLLLKNQDIRRECQANAGLKLTSFSILRMRLASPDVAMAAIGKVATPSLVRFLYRSFTKTPCFLRLNSVTCPSPCKNSPDKHGNAPLRWTCCKGSPVACRSASGTPSWLRCIFNTLSAV